MGAAALPASLTSQHWVPSCSNAIAQTHVRNQPSPSAPTGTGRAQHPGAGRGCRAQHPGALRAPRASARQAGARRRRGRPVGRLNSPEGLRSPPEGGLGKRRGPRPAPCERQQPSARLPFGTTPAARSPPRQRRAGGRRRRGRPLRRGFKLAGKSRGVGSGSPTTALPQRGTPPPPPPSPPGSEGTPPGRQRSRPLPAPPPAMAARGAERRGRAGGSAGGSPPARSAL